MQDGLNGITPRTANQVLKAYAVQDAKPAAAFSGSAEPEKAAAQPTPVQATKAASRPRKDNSKTTNRRAIAMACCCVYDSTHARHLRRLDYIVVAIC